MVRFFVLLLCVLLTGCAAKPTGYYYSETSRNSNATGVYIYRPHHVLSGSALNIYVDDHGVARLKDGGYVYLTLAPGYHVIGTPAHNDQLFKRMVTYPVTLNLHQIRYLKTVWREENPNRPLHRGQWIFVEVSPSVAQQELPAMRESS